MKEKNTRGYLSFFKMMRECMGQGTVEDLLLRYEYGMTEEDEDKRDLCDIATRGLTEQDMPFDQQLSWYFWYSLAMLVPFLHGDVQDHPEKYEEGVSAHVLVLEQLRARLDAWRYGYMDRNDVEHCVPAGEPERQRAALDFAIRSFEAFLQTPDPSGEAP